MIMTSELRRVSPCLIFLRQCDLGQTGFALVCPTTCSLSSALAAVHAVLKCCHLSCQTRTYLEPSVDLDLLLVVVITLPILYYLVGKISSFSLKVMKF